MTDRKPLPKTACLLCGVIMPERMVKTPWGHAPTCPILGMKRIETPEEKAKREKQERERA